MSLIITQQQYDAYAADIKEKKERLRYEQDNFQQNCIDRYMRDGRSEGLDEFINDMSIKFTETAMHAEKCIKEMEKLLAKAEIL